MCKIKVNKRKFMLLLKVNVVIIEYDWVCLNKQCSEYAWGPKRAKILNMAKFQGMNSSGGGRGGEGGS